MDIEICSISGQSVIKWLAYSTKPAQLDDHSHDLLITAQKLLSEMNQIEWKWRHIPGHQDRNPTHPLDIWAERNILMDARATITYTIIPSEQTANHYDPALITVWLSDTLVVQETSARIRSHVHTPPLMNYWEKKKKFGDLDHRAVSWKVLGTALSEVNWKRRHWVIKHTSGVCAVGVQMLRRKEWKHSRCPRCGEDQESTTHVWVCPDPRAGELWNKEMQGFQTWLHQNRTHLEVSEVIIANLNAWRNGQPFPVYTGNYPGLRNAVTQQTLLGWGAAFEGRWHTSWESIQQLHFKNCGLRRSGRRWLIAMVIKLWNTAWNMWEHRNGVMVEVQEEEARLEALTELEAEYTLGSQYLPPYDRLLFRRPLESRKLDKLHLIQSFLRRIKAARERMAHSQVHLQRMMMRRFFRMNHSE